MIVLHMLFDSQHLENYMLTKIRQFSSNVHVVDNIQQALDSPETDKIIKERLEALYSLPEGHYLEVLGLTKEQLKPMIKPSIISLCAESAPMVLDTISGGKRDQVGHSNSPVASWGLATHILRVHLVAQHILVDSHPIQSYYTILRQLHSISI